MRIFAAAAIMAVNVLADQQQDIDNASAAATAAADLADAIKVSNQAFKVAKALYPLCEALEALDPIFAVLGMVGSLLGFLDNDTKMILDKLQEIENKVV